MHFAFADQAIVFVTGWTAIVVEFCIESKDCLAAGCGAPTRIFHVQVYIVLKGKFLIFLL